MSRLWRQLGSVACCTLLFCGCAAAVVRAQTPAASSGAPAPDMAGLPASSANLCLLWPFVNRSGNTSLDWIGKSFVVELREQLDGGGVEFVSQRQRAAAMKLVGAPPRAELSHATLIGIGQQAGARWLVTGWFDDDGNDFRAGAWVFDLQREHLVALAPQSGPLDGLEAVQRRLAWAVRQQIEPASSSALGASSAAKPETAQNLPPLPLPAYEGYVRAQMAASPSVRLKELQIAAHFAPRDPRIESSLGGAYFSTGDNANALYWLRQVPTDSHLWPQAGFFAAIAEYRLGKYTEAARMFGTLQQQFPLPSVTANLARARAQSEHPVTPAPALETAFPISTYRQLRREVTRFEAAKLQALPPDRQARREIEAAQRLAAHGGLDAAALEFQKVVSASPDPALTSTAHAGLAGIWLKRHNLSQARAELKKALATQSGNPQALAVQRALHAASAASGPTASSAGKRSSGTR